LDRDRDIVSVQVVPRPFAVGAGVELPVAHRELDAVRHQALMQVERLLGDLAERGQVSLPAKWTDGEVLVDALDPIVAHRAVALSSDVAERDRLGDVRLLDLVSRGLRALPGGLHLGTQGGAHLVREAGDRTEADDRRRIALIRPGGAHTVAAHERVLRLRPRAVGPALRVTAE